MTATLGGKRLRNSGVDEVLEPWWVTFNMVKVQKYIQPELRFRALLTEGGAKVLFHHELRSRTLPTVSAL
jgi:hypothetical protein